MSTKNSLSHTKRYKIVLSINHMVYRLINSTYNLKELTLRLAKFICQVLNSGYCSVSLLEPNKNIIRLKATVGLNKRDVSTKKTKLKNGLEKKIIGSSRGFMKDSILGIPLIGEETLGAIIVKKNGKRSNYESFDQEILTAIAEQAVTAIKNLELYEEQQKIVYGCIKSLVTILDKKVPFLTVHITKYAILVVEMAKELHLHESQIMSLQHAILLHDAGKVDIPLEILTKRSKLTSEEYGIMKSHPEKGAEIIRPLEALKPVIPIILYHHEKYDGSGYPSGLRKEEIPIEARIMSVADAFEAMISSRPYKTKKTIDEAIEEIKRNSGTQFDPRVVGAFLKLSKKRKFKKYLSFHH